MSVFYDLPFMPVYALPGESATGGPHSKSGHKNPVVILSYFVRFVTVVTMMLDPSPPLTRVLSFRVPTRRKPQTKPL